MTDSVESTLDADQWRLEAQALINDVKSHVKDIRVSEKLDSSEKVIYLNVTTLEGQDFCVELSAAGLSIVGPRHDDISTKGDVFFETPYSLLDFISPKYRESFGNLLLTKLNALNGQE